jgi:hypothetical protein
MKEKAITKFYIDQTNNVLDCIDGKITPRETMTFIGSHAVDTSKEEKRLEDIRKDRAIKPEQVKKKKVK